MYDGGSMTLPLTWKVRFFDGTNDSESIDPVASNPDFWDDGVPYIRNTDFKGAQAQISADWRRFLVTAGTDWINYNIDTTPWPPQKSEFDDIAGKLEKRAMTIIPNLSYCSFYVTPRFAY